MNTAAKSTGEAAPASQEGRPQGRRPAWQRLLLAPAVLLGAYLVVRALVELATIHYNVPASYAKDWGGPSLAGVLAVHAGPGIAVLVTTIWWGLRRGPRGSDAARP